MFVKSLQMAGEFGVPEFEPMRFKPDEAWRRVFFGLPFFCPHKRKVT